MTTLVTGASGFIGSALVRQLVGAGHRVRAFVRPTSNLQSLEGVDCELVSGDLSDRRSLDAAVAGCEVVFHVGADYRFGARNRDALYRTNVEGTRNLMLAAAGAPVTRIVYTSSVATIHCAEDGHPVDETTPTRLADMVGHYKRSKYLAEREVMRLARHDTLPVVIVSPSAVFGPRDVRPTPTGRIVVDFARGRMPAYVDTGLNVVHVEDVVRGHLLALQHGVVGERYILGGDNMSLREILGLLARHLARRPPKLRLPRAPLLPVAWTVESIARMTGREPVMTVEEVQMAKRRMYFSSYKARKSLGYDPRRGTEALVEAADWFRANRYF